MSDQTRADQALDPLAHRHAAHPIDPEFLRRWSPRAMSGEPVAAEELLRLFEAAHWAPSSGNGQPWRFLYARRDTPAWPSFFDLLMPGNQSWCARAGALIVIVSKTTFEHNGKPSPTHSYDTGAAWGYLALQGSKQGLVVHGMAGFDYAKAREVLRIPEDFKVEAMAAVGRPGRKEDLTPDQQAREVPNQRKPVEELVREGAW